MALGTFFRAAGELIAKPASLLFYIVIARELGEDDFGAFIFGLSLSTVLLAGAGLGTQELMARKVARDHSRVDELFANIVAIKGAMAVAILLVIAVVVTAADYSTDASIAILVIAVGVGFEYQISVFSAVFQAFERQQYIASALLINRLSTAAVGIGLALAGAGLLTISIVFTAGSALGLISSYVLMRRRVARPRMQIAPSTWIPLLRQSFPLGVLEILSVVSLRSSIVVLGLFAASSAEVGQYGAAFRLIEATLFIPWSFSSAVMPWFSRRTGAARASLAQGFELSLKAIVGAMLPICLVLGLFAEDIIALLYGEDYMGAVLPLQVLSGMTVLWGINAVISAVLVGQNRPAVYIGPAVASIALNLALSAWLIPEHGAVGAAAATLPSVTLLACLAIAATTRVTGTISIFRVLAACLGAAAAAAAVSLVLDDVAWALAATATAAAYAAAFLLIERRFYPEDFAYFRRALSLRSADTPAVTEPVRFD